MRYRWYSFLARLAFICNILFTGCMIFRYSNIQPPQVVTGFMITAGWILSPIINILANFALLLFLIKGIRNIVPAWLNAINLFFLFFQIFYFILLQN